MLAAFLTAFYSWRLLIMTFHGKSRADHHVLEHVHESPPVMIVPLLVLASARVVAGIAARPVVHRRRLAGILERQHLQWRRTTMCSPRWSTCRPGSRWRRSSSALAGIALAYVMYMAFPLLPMQLASTFRRIYLFLLNKWYFDELYDAIFVQPTIRLARMLWQAGDVTLIDGVPNGLAELAVDGSRQAVKIQTGSLAVYAFAMLIGVVVAGRRLFLVVR